MVFKPPATATEQATARSLRAAGASLESIAHRLGRSRQTIAGWLKVGTEPRLARPWSPSEERLLLEIPEGEDPADAAAILSRRTSDVRKKLKQLRDTAAQEEQLKA